MEKKTQKYAKKSYDQSTLEKAVQEIRLGAKLCEVHLKYDIPKGTLSNKVNNKTPIDARKGPQTVLTAEEEKRVADWIIAKAKLGFPMHPDEVKDSVQRVIIEKKRMTPFTEDRPGEKWMQLFLKRQPHIAKRQAEIISKARAAVTEEGIRDWFGELREYLKEENCEDILNDGSRIFNCDETGVHTCPETGKVLGPKVYRNFYEIAGGKEKECITNLCNFSADGRIAPAMTVYPYQRIPRHISESVADDWVIGRSDSGILKNPTYIIY